MKQNTNIKFNGQRQDEKVLLKFNRHFIAVRKGLLIFAIIFILSAIPPLIWQDNLQLFLLPIVGLLLGSIILSYYIMLWHFSCFIVTDQRIRQITQRSFFNKIEVDLRFSKIQSIVHIVPGFMGEMFHFGTIIIKTLVGDVIIKDVNKSEEVYNKLNDVHGNVINSEGASEEIN